ncbi:pitrilysin family protein [Phreatobacter sp.]|uniref:M16 family metallopeptidase n=1 Tax=Phreatobacter sp. TaxID=1966341 RepID=UPI0022C8186D|nr:pitrilysin family protein [Phreatobacter sp.]MCZ8313355.1 pitrilysin family protein [Phreatobacter sp.]
MRPALAWLAAGTLAMLASLSPTPPAQAQPQGGRDQGSRVQRVTSPGGIEAWLVRQTHLPVLALSFAMKGGTAQDPQGRAGTANMVAAMMDEGAGDLDAETFSARLQDRAIEISFAASRDTFSGSMRTLTDNRAEAAALLRMALTVPRFDAAPLERIRQAVLASIRRGSTTPGTIASDLFWSTAFPGHPYGRRSAGTVDSVEAITVEDLRDLHGRVLAREHLKVAVVGDITTEELGPLLDEIFGALPAKARLTAVPSVAMAGLGERRVVPLDVPQATISFGLPGVTREDPDFITAFVLNHILGGGGFSSRLYQEVREKRGLAYSVSSGIAALDAAGMVTGGTSTRNDRAAESLAVITAELKRMGAEGPTAIELEQAKRYLIGSWALRFETSIQIASNLIRIQLDGLGIDYLDQRNALIEAVSLDDVKRVAKRLFADPRMLVVVVGKPEGM